MFKNDKKLCNQDIDKLSKGSFSTKKEKTPSGTSVEVIRFKDGSSKVKWGGPCGSTNYNEFGEEC